MVLMRSIWSNQAGRDFWLVEVVLVLVVVFTGKFYYGVCLGAGMVPK